MVTMCHEVSRWCISPEMVACKVLKPIGELEIVLMMDILSSTIASTYMIEICNMAAQTTRGFAPLIL